MIDRLKILVTGANGQLGMELRDLAASYPQYEFIFTTREDMPLDNFTAMAEFFHTYRPKYCINCAAYTKVDSAESETDDAFLINSEAVFVLADLCQEYETLLVHISTDYVFD